MSKEDILNGNNLEQDGVVEDMDDMTHTQDFEFEDLNGDGEELSQKDKIKKLQEKIKVLSKETSFLLSIVERFGRKRG